MRFSEDLASIIPPSHLDYLASIQPNASEPPSTDPAQEGHTHWHIPNYAEDHPRSPQPATLASQEIAPDETSRFHPSAVDRRRHGDEVYPRGARDSALWDDDSTVFNDSVYSLSSYRHPYDIQPPSLAYNMTGTGGPDVPETSRSLKSEGDDDANDDEIDKHKKRFAKKLEDRRRRKSELEDLQRNGGGVLSNLIDLYGVENGFDVESGTFRTPGRLGGLGPGDVDPRALDACQVLDPDDPLITGVKKNRLDGAEDLEKAKLRDMDYKSRRKVRQQMRIEFNITCAILTPCCFL